MTARTLRALAVGATLAALTLSTAWGLLFYRPLPTLDGYYRLLGLHERAEVIRDVFGIPRIYARDLHDLFFLQGYVTAQDRFAQMEAMRDAARATPLPQGGTLPEAVREALDAYAAGVTKFLDQHSEARAMPGEVVLGGRRPAAWTQADSVAILARYIIGGGSTYECAAIADTGSAKGRPLLAADLYTDAPAPGWYEVGLHADEIRAVGVSLPGVPGIVAGHNGWIAWAGVTADGVEPAVALASLFEVAGRRGTPARPNSSVTIGCVTDRPAVSAGTHMAPLRGVVPPRSLDIEALRAMLGRPRAPVGARLLIDMADVDGSRSAVSHGASAHLASPHRDDQAPLWELGRTHRLPFTRGAIGRTDGELVFRAR